MAEINCFTFDASTGEVTMGIQLEKHLGLQVPIEEHNKEKKHVKVCPHSAPNFDAEKLTLCSAKLDKDRIVAVKTPKSVLLHVTNAHKVKTRKDSAHGVTVRGSRTALVNIHEGNGITIHNSTSRWHLHLPERTLQVAVVRG